MVVHARGQAGFTVGGHRIGCHRHDRQVRAPEVVTDVAGGGQAVHHRHLQVHQHDVERRRRRRPRPPPLPARWRRRAPGRLRLPAVPAPPAGCWGCPRPPAGAVRPGAGPAPRQPAARGAAAIAPRRASATASNSIDAVTGLTRKPSSSACSAALRCSSISRPWAVTITTSGASPASPPAQMRRAVSQPSMPASASRGTWRRSVGRARPVRAAAPALARRWPPHRPPSPASGSCAAALRAQWRCRPPPARAAATARPHGGSSPAGSGHRQRDVEVKAAALRPARCPAAVRRPSAPPVAG